jgi:hypothetical protein
MHTNKEIRVKVSNHAAVDIYDLLGGEAFENSTGAKDFVTQDTGQPRLLMRLPAGKTTKRGTHMEISLSPTDNYLLVFFKNKRRSWRNDSLGLKAKPERQFIGVEREVPASQLRSTFEALTGLRIAA